MFQLEWADKTQWRKENRVEGIPVTGLSPDAVRRALVLRWEEHCLECAPPQCYRACLLYRARPDGNCRNLAYGIAAVASATGLFPFGCDVRFRPWAKLETKVFPGALTPRLLRLLQRIDRFSAGLLRTLLFPLTWKKLRLRANRAAELAGASLLTLTARLFSGCSLLMDDFIVEAYSLEPSPFKLIIETRGKNGLNARHAVHLNPGPNLHALAASSLRLDFRDKSSLITIYPEHDAPARVIFTWLDIVAYAPHARKPAPAPAAGGAKKIKCVVWDLDNTLWQGILLEDGAEKLRLNPSAAALIKSLDERGILNSVASKNNHADAWAVIGSFGLGEYFLHPEIGWAPKSESIRRIARSLNLGLDAFAFIDDSAFERAEVAAALPQVRTYPADEITDLLSREEFDVAVTETSRTRRLSYVTEIRRSEAQRAYPDDYRAFLKSCGMKIRFFTPSAPADVQRCLELIHRSNQLNSSGRLYEETSLRALLAQPGRLCAALSCADKFGDYGIVGFINVAVGGEVRIEDFVLSCRVARKGVEDAVFSWLSGHPACAGAGVIRARFVRTPRNTPLRDAFSEAGFRPAPDPADSETLEVAADALRAIEAIPEILSDE